MDYYDQIEAYLNNTLSESERTDFEEAMGKDENLKQAVEDHEVAMDVVGSILESEVRSAINSEELIINNESGEVTIENGKLKIENDGGDVGGKKVGRVRRMNWMRWASAAVVVFVLGWWGMNLYSFRALEEEIFAIRELPDNSGVRGVVNGASLIDSISHLFDLGRNEESLELCSQINQSDKSEEVIFYEAHNLFELREYDSCIKTIESLSEVKSDSLKKLLIYCYRLRGNIIKAKEIYQTLDFKDDRLLKILE